MLDFRKRFGTNDERQEFQLEIYKTMIDNDNPAALPAALLYCVESKIAPPKWLIVAAINLLCTLMRNQRSTKRGRASGIVPRLRQDMIDFARFDAVREKQVEIPEQVRELESIKGAPRSRLKDRRRMQSWVGRDWIQAYQCASMLLKGSQAFGRPDSIKASYQRVLRNSRRGTRRYHLLDPRILDALGIGDVAKVPRDKKITPFYDLTL